jgi:peptidoglycan/LPS O-acetylase OafA/YrhL
LSPYWQDSLVPGGWSVAVESLFYFSFPLLTQNIDSIKQCLIWLTVSIYFSNLLVVFLEHSILLSKINKDILSGYLYGFYPAQFHVFIFGFLLFLIEDLNFILKIKYLILVSISILPLILVDFFWLDLTQLNNFYVSWFIVLCISISKNFLMQKNYLFSLIQEIGKISFGIYLFHFMILFYLNKNSTFDKIIANYQVGLFLVVFVSSSLISIFFYKLLEKPFIRFGADLIYKFENIK